MKKQAILRGCAAFSAALAVLSFASVLCFAEETDVDYDDIETVAETEDTDETETAAETEDTDDTETAAETEDSDDSEEIPTYTSGDYTYSILVSESDENKKAAQIESYSGGEDVVVIPSEIDDLTVVALGDNAFAGAYYITSITLPSTVTQIGVYTFAACSSLQDYIVEEGNPYFEAKDGVLYADEGTSLMRYPVGRQPTELVIPDDVLRIGHVAFSDCKSLTKVTFPEGLIYIGQAAFAECSGLTEAVIPEGVTEITDFCFNNCKSLKSVTLPENLTAIGAAAFSATALTSVKLPETLTSIGEQAFISTPMKEITVPKSVSDIGFTALGWDVQADGMLYSKEDFIVRGYRGSAAETYVTDEEYENACSFEALELEVPELVDNSRETTEPSGNSSSGVLKVVGISACVAAIIGILTVAIVSGKKKKKGEPQEESETSDPEDSSETAAEDVQQDDEDDGDAAQEKIEATEEQKDEA